MLCRKRNKKIHRRVKAFFLLGAKAKEELYRY
jgi:hypothetical protein